MKFDKIYDHAIFEKQSQDLWNQEKTYVFKSNAPTKTFSIDTPPPTVSGTLHIGHVFSYTHADLIARYKRMQGYNVFYPMGFDDNGLPTERFVEKKNNVKAYLMKRSAFISLCLKETHDVEKLFEDLWRKIGLSIDWTKTYSTISPQTQRISQYSFIELYKKGHVYRKKEPALYCTTCRTSVAQAELDSTEVATTFNNIIFTTQLGEKLTIATTRPELLPGCVAIFFHPEDARYKHLLNSFAITPIFEKPIRIMADEKVNPAKGTGLVMCCTFGDQTDIQWYKSYQLPFEHIVGFDGKWTQASGPLAGLNVHDARKKILELLAATQALGEQKSITHNVNVHERCKQEIEYLLLNQWFVKILDHKETFIKLADKITWKPEFMKARYKDWVQNLHWDWCISRQRFFGIPFPVWHCLDCSHIILADPKMLPIDPQEQAYPGNKCPACASTHLEADTDVMDTWNTSALTPQINVHWPDQSPDDLNLPMSMRPQAHDIIRTWAFDTIVKAYYHHNNIPWQNIMISGHVLAGKEKISKSKENSKMTPESLLSSYPADAIRYWAASGRLGSDTAFSENQLKIGQRLLTKLWNAYKFIDEHIVDIKMNGTIHANFITQDALNQWLLHKLSTTYKQYQQQFEEYEYPVALEIAEAFFWKDFCDNYLELIKDRFFNPQAYTNDIIQETKYTLYQAGYAQLQMFSAFIPHITETLYQLMYKNNESISSLHLCLFDNKRFDYNFQQSNNLIAHVLDVVTTVRKLKSEKQLSLKTELKILAIYCDNLKKNMISSQKLLLMGITKAQDLQFIDATLEQSVLIEENGALIAKVSLP